MSLLAQQGRMMRRGELWTPADLAVQPRVWCDWDSPVTDVGGYASAWTNDKGSIGGAFVQASSGSRPEILNAEVNGRRVLRFDGANDGLIMTSDPAGNIYRAVSFGWCFLALRKRTTDASATRVAIYAPAFNDASRLHVGVGLASPSQNRAYVQSRRVDGDATVTNIGGLTPVGAWSLRRVVADWGNNSLTDYVDGALSATGATGGSAGSTSNSAGRATELRLGSNVGAAAADIDVAALLMGAGAYLTSGDFHRIEGWAAWQLGLEANLPSGHPYKLGPPTK